MVRENIVRHSAMGKGHKQASLEGTQEIGLAVLATTLSIVAVFIPIGTMEGIIGRFFKQFGITVAAAVLISMFVSFTLDPMLSSVWPDPVRDPNKVPTTRIGRFFAKLGKMLEWFDEMTQKLAGVYQKALAWSLIYRKTTLAIALSTLLACIPIVQFLGTEFVPQADYSESGVQFFTPVGSSLEFTQSKAQQVDTVLRSFPEVQYTYMTINTASSGKNYVSTYVRLKNRNERTRSQSQLTRPIREALGAIAGITLTSVGTTDPVGGEKTLVYSVQGADQKVLQRITDDAMSKLKAIPGMVDLDTSSKPSKPTIAVDVKRQAAADAGLTATQIAGALRPLIGGEIAGTWRAPDDQNYDIDVRLAQSERSTLEDLAKISIVGQNADGSPKLTKLTQVATLTPSVGASQINRRDLAREIRIDANVFGRTAGEVNADAKAVFNALVLPPGYKVTVGGSSKNMAESFGYALTALALAIIFIYMILASQFGSFLQPIAIMSSLPLTLIGVILALLAFGSSLSMFSIIGFILLMGLVTKNAILLVDFINLTREQGQSRHFAILEAARVRLRPILMTTLAMVFGMVPLAFGLSEGSEQRAPMGQAVIGGTITSSVLTLVVVPVIYTYLDDLAVWARRVFGKKAA